MFVLKAEIGKTDFFLYNSSIQQWLVNLACSVKSYPDIDTKFVFMQKYRLYSQIKSFTAVFPSMGAYTSVQNVQNVPSFCVIAIDNAQRPKF